MKPRNSISAAARRSAAASLAACLICLAGTLAACSSEDPDTDVAGPAPSSSVAAATLSAAVPGHVEDGNCTSSEQPAAPDACSWAASTDAVVWGVIRDIKLVDTPAVAAWNSKDGWQWATECDAVNPAIELVIDVRRVLSGDKSLVGPLTVKIGTRQREHFDPMPVRDARGALAWEKIGTSKGGPLTIGQDIGLPLHYVTEFQVWSLMGESPFSLGPSGAIAFQDRRGQCGEPSPIAVAGQALDAVARSLASCAPATAAGNARRSRMRALWGAAQDPTAFMAAACFRKQPPPGPGTCVISADCDGVQQCIAGACRAP
jgi:hypothetical protein